MKLPPKARERLQRARAAHRAATLPLIEILQGLVQPEPVAPAARAGPPARARARHGRARRPERLREARAILGRMEAASRPRADQRGDAWAQQAPESPGRPPSASRRGDDVRAGRTRAADPQGRWRPAWAAPSTSYGWVRNTIAPRVLLRRDEGRRRDLPRERAATTRTRPPSSSSCSGPRASRRATRAGRSRCPVRRSRRSAAPPTSSRPCASSSVAVCRTRSLPGGGGVAAVKMERVWAEAYLPYANYRGTLLDAQGGAWIPLDPAFKRLGTPNTYDVVASLGFDADATWREYLAASRAAAPLEFVRGRVGAAADREAGRYHLRRDPQHPRRRARGAGHPAEQPALQGARTHRGELRPARVRSGTWFASSPSATGRRCSTPASRSRTSWAGA